MRYMGLVIMDPNQGPPTQELMEAMDAHAAKNAADGIFLDGGGLGQGENRIGYQVRAGQVSTTDGPFTEAKEIIGGYAILEYRNHAEAVEGARQMAEIHRQFWPGWEGRVEVHLIQGAPEPEAGA
ncbi:MAG: YciI family protein [Mycobacterium sp.]